MSNFRTKLLGLAAMATLFVSASYAQTGVVSCAAAFGTGTASVQPGPANGRAEGTTELMGDALFNCVNNAASASATVSVFATAPVTSQLLSPQPVAGGTQTEAALFICSVNGTTNCTPAAPGVSAPYYGTVNGTQLTFTGVVIPANNFSGRIYNVRVNASAVTIAATLTPVTETILVSANNTSAATAAITTGYVFKSLVAPALIANPNGANTATITAYTVCAGNALSSSAARAISFAVGVGETFGGAFKVGTGISTGNGEGGSYVPGGPGAVFGTPGSASFGTRITLAFANVAAAETVYVPVSVTNNVNGGALTLTLTGSPTGTLSPVAASTATGAPSAVGVGGAPFNFGAPAPYPGISYAASAALTPVNGAVTATYEVTSSVPALIQSTVIPVFVTFAANSFTTVPAVITTLESYAPTAAAAAATTIPNFAPPTNAALNTTALGLCQTSLLFPYVVSVLGFDTGIVLANTSADPFGDTPTAGSCTLNYYGTGTPTPSTGIVPAGQPQAAGASVAFLSSTYAPGFDGYMIAVCTYNFGKGFAFIEDGLGTNTGVVEGYVADVINDRNPNATGGSGTAEGLGQ